MVLCLVLICLMPTVQAQENAQEWVFRNGVTWNSTIGDVMACEDGEAETGEAEGMSALLYGDASVSRYSGQLLYMFDGDALLMAGYKMYSMAEEDIGYLKGALDFKYGAAVRNDVEYIRLVMRTIEERMGGEAENTMTEELQGMWRLEDGTLIFLTSMPVFDGYTVNLFYLNEAYFLEAYPIYNTDGL
jgi:hypothetical protein